MSPADRPQGREGHEPTELPRGVPWVVSAVILAIVGWGAWTFIDEVDDGLGPYGDGRSPVALGLTDLQPDQDPLAVVENYAGRHQGECTSWLVSSRTGERYCASPALELDGIVTASASTEAGGSASVDGGQIYASRCAACHQADGNGLAGAFPPLANSSWVLGAADRPVGIVVNGLQGAIEVEGTTYAGVMPTFADQLSDAEIAAVLTYVRASFGNSASAIDEALVAEVRAQTDGHGAIQGQAELEALFP